MTTNGNGHVPARIVELLMNNLSELTKHIESLPGNLSKEMAAPLKQLGDGILKVNEKMSTPPRHEELNNHLENIRESLGKLKRLVSRTMFAVKIVAAVLSAAVLIASIIVTVSNNNLEKKLNPRPVVTSVSPSEDINRRLERIEGILKDNRKP